MRKTERAIVCLLVVLVCWTPLPAQTAGSAAKNAEDRILALRAARAVAMRKTEERVGSLAVAPKTTVRNLVDESDELRWALQAFLLGLRESSPPQYAQGGVCTVKVQVARAELIAALRKMQRDYCPKGSKFKTVDFTKVRWGGAEQVIRVVGTSAVRPEQREDPLVPGEADGPMIPWEKFDKKVRDYWGKHCNKRGQLIALRVARIDAMRRLAEAIKNCPVTDTLKVKDLVTETDALTGGPAFEFLKIKLNFVGARYHSDNLIVETVIETDLGELHAALRKWVGGRPKAKAKLLAELARRAAQYRGTPLRETGFGVPLDQYVTAASPGMKAVIELAKRVPDWATHALRVTGRYPVDPKDSDRPGAKRAAWRAAEFDARRRLAHRTEDRTIASGTSVRDFLAKDDEIPTAMLAFLQGARVAKGSRKVSNKGVAELMMEIDLKPLWNMVVVHTKRLRNSP